MDNPGSPRLVARLLAEFFVIVIGVLVALAADRWLMTLDDRDLERGYLIALIEDVRADVAFANDARDRADRRYAWTLELLAAAENPGHIVSDTTGFVVSFETIAWSILPDFHTTTWTDLVSTGNMRLIRDEEVRRSLAELHERIDFHLSLERDWEAQLAEYDDLALHVMRPTRRVEIALGFGGRYRPEVNGEDLATVRAALSDDPRLGAQLGTVAIIHRARATGFRGLLDVMNRTLEVLEEYSSRVGA